MQTLKEVEALPGARPVTTVVRAGSLCKSYGGMAVVHGVSFEVHRGEIFGILGPNGAGKTTTVECLQGLRRADAGQLTVLGWDPWRDAARLRRRIGSQLQESSLPDRIRVGEALSFFARPGAEWRHLLVDWGLDAKRKTAFANLSGGQRQRLLVALALVNDPELVFLDEMTTGLDPAARRVAWDLILAIRRRGTTVVLVTHFMEEAERLCDRVAIMDRGRIVAQGTPGALIAQHAGDVEVRFTCPDPMGWLLQVPFVRAVDQDGSSCTVAGDGPVLAHVAAALVARGHAPPDLRVDRRSLEDVFLRLTGSSAEVA